LVAHARDQRYQFRETAAVQFELADLPAIDNAGKVGSLRLYLRDALTLNVHYFADLAHLESNVYARFLCYLHYDLLCPEGFESWSCDREIVSACRQPRRKIGALRVRGSSTRQPNTSVHHCHLRAWQDSAGGIANSSCDLSRILREGRAQAQSDQRRETHENSEGVHLRAPPTATEEIPRHERL
jgi:hypothetical protein